MLNRIIAISQGFLRNIVTILIDSVMKFFLPRTKPEPDVLGLVRLDDIGDFVTWLPAAKAIREHYKKEKITLIANRSWALLTTNLPYWDNVLSIDVSILKRNFFYRWQIFKEVRKLRCNTVIQPTYICHLTTGDSIVRMSGAVKKIGSAGNTLSKKNGWQKRLANKWYTKLINASPKPLHVFERDEEFITNLIGSHPFQEDVEIPKMLAPIDGLKPSCKYFMIFPGSNGKYKMWPKERFAKLASEIVLKSNYSALICGAPSEFELCEYIASRVPGAINLAGKTSITQAVELIRDSSFVLGNDSSSIHIAAITDTTSFCILGGGHYGMFMPYPSNWSGKIPHVINYDMPCYGCGWRCKFSNSKESPYPCIKNISEDSVLNTIKQKIEE